MAAKYYAWTDIRGGDADKAVLIRRGEEVTASKLGVSSEEFQEMVKAGSIKSKPFPAPDDYSGSAVDYFRDQLAEAQGAGDSTIEEAEVVSEMKELETS